MLISNAAVFSATPITGWIHVTLVGKSLKTDDGHNISVRANGNLEVNDNAGPNETFTQDGKTLVALIGEGYRVLHCVEIG